MDKLKKILVVMPQERRVTEALHRAAAYAHRTGAQLHLHLFDYYGPIDYARNVFGEEVSERARRDFLDERLDWLKKVSSGLAEQGLRVECDVIWAPKTWKAVLDSVARLQPDLVIKDVACSSAPQAVLEPATTEWQLLRRCPAPLMLVTPHAHLMPRNVLAAVDVGVAREVGGLNDSVMQATRAVCRLGHAETDVLSVFSYAPLPAYDAGFVADIYEIMENGHKEQFAAFAAAHHVDAAHALQRSSFDVAGTIAEVARERGSDLVVIGSAYHSAVDRLLIGTTAETLLRKLSCDVLLIKPQWVTAAPGADGAPAKPPREVTVAA